MCPMMFSHCEIRISSQTSVSFYCYDYVAASSKYQRIWAAIPQPCIIINSLRLIQHVKVLQIIIQWYTSDKLENYL